MLRANDNTSAKSFIFRREVLKRNESVTVKCGAFREECGERACIYGALFRSGSLNCRVSPDEELSAETQGRKEGGAAVGMFPQGMETVSLFQLGFAVPGALWGSSLTLTRTLTGELLLPSPFHG